MALLTPFSPGSYTGGLPGGRLQALPAAPAARSLVDRSRRRGVPGFMRVVPLLALCLLLSGTALAQEASMPQGEEKVVEGGKSLRAMRQSLARVERALEEARRERDALRLHCVHERRTQIVALLRVAENALADLRVALGTGQEEAARHEFGKIAIARVKVDGYRVEADECIGLLAFYDGEGIERQFTDENDYAEGADPTHPEAIDPMPFRPPPASPVR